MVQLENKPEWYIDQQLLSAYTSESSDIDETELPTKYNFFRFENVVPNETEEERLEKERIILEQIKLGILRVDHGNTILSNNQYPEQLNIKTTPIRLIMENNKFTLINQKQNTFNNLNIQKQSQPIKKISKNDPCHCGSGKLYKKCHGKYIR